MASVSTSVAQSSECFRRWLEVMARDAGHAPVGFGSECADFDGQSIADKHFPGRFRVLQPGPVGAAKSGTLVVVDKVQRIHATDVLLGAHATREGGGIRDRWIVRAQTVRDAGTPHQWLTPWLNSGHADPARAPKARAAFMAVFRSLPGVKGGDLNLAAKAVERTLNNARVLSMRREVLHVAIPRWIPSGPLTTYDIGSDHPAGRVVLWP